MMWELVIQFLVIWVAIDIVIIASGWYLVNVVKPRYPGWWRRMVVDEEPAYVASHKRLSKESLLARWAIKE